MGLIGNFEHKLDAKGRVVIPACFRDELGSRVVATTTDNKCISLYSEDSWEEVLTRVGEAAKQVPEKGAAIQRRLMSGSFYLDIDSMGRVLLPDKLRSITSIAQDVCVNGNNNKLEIWDASLWRKFIEESEDLVPEISALIPGL
jgi:MraZ protein